MRENKRSILLVDDNKENLTSLVGRLSALLPGVELIAWWPTDHDGPPADAFNARVNADTVLVVTDYDLTTTVKGLFGLSIVAWCQARSIPVGDFSRGNVAVLPKEPNLFEMRVPIDEVESAKFIATMFLGFTGISDMIRGRPELLTNRRSLAAVLSAILGRPRAETQFAAYMSRLGAANSSLLQKLRDYAGEDVKPADEDKIRLLTYVLGHVLSNAVLKYPGPILSGRALCAYIGTTIEEIEHVAGIFGAAVYTGPFSSSTLQFWRDDVDMVLDKEGADLGTEQFDGFGDYNREVVERILGRPLATHGCNRCGGVKGGFWCPFTQRPVCERADCSVPASSWIPSGAQLSRVERDFYDEWAPILGL